MTKLEELKRKLKSLRASNKSAWETYGSELCAGEMIREEKELEAQILTEGGDRFDLLDCY